MNFQVSASDAAVQAWSTARPPFEPKGWLLDLRREIRGALSHISRPSDRLYGYYSSAQTGLCDVENVLFYNVGTGYFRGLVEREIAFERGFSQPRPAPSGELFPHYLLYASSRVPLNWREAGVIAEWEFPIRPTGHTGLLSSIWSEMKSCSQFRAEVKDTPLDRYGLELELRLPRSITLDLAAFVKPAFDGVISALHFYSGSRLAEVSRVLAQTLNEPEEVIAEKLLDESRAVLGPRQVLWPWKTGIQWNPADDTCLQGVLKRADSSGSPVLRGSIYTLT